MPAMGVADYLGRRNKSRLGMAQFLPKSFQHRGIAVAFTSPVLAFARCRRPPGESKVEYLVPGLAGSTEAYVLPNKALPEIVTLTIFDRALHEELPTLRKVTPLTVRSAVHKIALTGLGGPGPMRQAREAQERTKGLPAAIMVSLVHRAIQQLAAKEPDAAGLDEAKIGTPEGLTLARKALSGYSQGSGISSADIMGRLEQWGKMAAPLGGAGGAHPGHLTDTLAATEALADKMTKWLIPEPPETGEMAQRTALAAREAVTVARRTINELDGLAANLNDTLSKWDSSRRIITEGVEKVALVLDGWSRIVSYWTEAEAKDRFFQRTTLENFAQYLPMLPRDSGSEATEMWENLRESQTRWNQSAQVKLSSHLDASAREKLSQFRKEAV